MASIRTKLLSLFPSFLCLTLFTACGGGGGDGGTEAAYSPPVDQFSYSGDIRVDSLLTPPEQQWNWNFVAQGRGLQYTFDITNASKRFTRATSFNATQRSAAIAILKHVTSITGIPFVEAANSQDADFSFLVANAGGFGQVHWSASTERPAAYILLNYDNVYRPSDPTEDPFGFQTPLAGTFGYMVLLHEVGHAIGLKHVNEGANKVPAADAILTNSVMLASYGGGGASTFQPYDLLALKWIYGGDGLGGDRGFNSRLGPSLN